MKSIGTILIALLYCALALAARPAPAAEDAKLPPLDLLADAKAWQAGTDRPTTRQTLEFVGGILTTDITGDGGAEDYPKLTRQIAEAQDWRGYALLRARVRVTSDDPEARTKRLAFIFYDDKKRRADLADRPMTQQGLEHMVPVGRWVELKDWLDPIERSAIRQVQIYVYEVPPAKAHHFRWEVASLRLETLQGAFDGQVYPPEALKGSRTAPAGEVATRDGLRLALGAGGDVAAVTVDGRNIGASSAAQPSGLLVRDVAAGAPPVAVGGSVRREGGLLRHTAALKDLGLSVDATYRAAGDTIEIRGTLADTRGADRAVTLYFALPVAEAPWEWWDSAAVSRTKPGQAGEFAYLEPRMGYGLEGRHSKYPLGSLTWPGTAGLNLAIRMDEPVVHRIFYNPRLRLFTIAFDFGLVPEKRVQGPPLSEAPFRILLYRSDPAWGFRAALQRYYGFFPDFFTKRVKREGGWYVWGNVRDTPGAVEAGFGFHWGPAGDAAVKYDNENGLLALYYIEPELHQQTMGDYDRAPTVAEVMERLRKLADADPEETAKAEKLSYSYVRSGRPFLKAISQATFQSAFYDADGKPYCGISRMSWIGDSQWGAILPCNLDPDIPEGKGWFNREFMLKKMLADWGSQEARYDGIGLDSFGGYGQFSRVSYRRDLFRYSEYPLSFAASDAQPVQVAFFATLEWLRALARDVHARDKVLMANCVWGVTPGWLTFAAPYLDVFGAESPRFDDPDFIRAIAYRKPCTDLPYKPQPEWDARSRVLHGIYLGHGHDLAVMRNCIVPLRQLAAAGWEPITGARVQPGSLRLERFGSGEQVFFALHNPVDENAQAEITVDPGTLGWPAGAAVKASVLFPAGGRAAPVQGRRISLPLAGRETVVLILTRLA